MVRKRMHNEINEELARDVYKALKGGMSQLAAARRFRLSRSTVQRIDYGQHVLQVKGSAFGRCQGCGARVIQPCRKCSQKPCKGRSDGDTRRL